MSENLRKCFPKLEVLAQIKSKKSRRQTLSAMSDDSLYHAIKEIISNLLQKNIKLTRNQRRSLSRCKKTIVTIAKHKGKANRKHIVVQSGGFLHILIPAVAAVLGSVLNGAL